MPISDQVMQDLREVASTFTRAVREGGVEAVAAYPADARLVLRVLASLLDEVESRRAGVSPLPEWVTVLGKDFLALYQYARAVTDTAKAGTREREMSVEGLALQVQRLAPLYDDTRAQLNLRSRSAREAYRSAAGGPLPFVMRDLDTSLHDELVARADAARAWPYEKRSALPPSQREALPLGEVACQLVDLAIETGQVTAAHVTQQGDVVEVRLTRSAEGIPLDGDHTVRVLQPDGSIRVECDHKFLGTTACVRCRKSFDELRAESAAELARLRPETLDEAARRHGLAVAPDGSMCLLDPPDLRLPSMLPDGVLRASPADMAGIIQRQLDEHQGAGIINREALDRTIEGARIEGAGTDEVRVTVTAPPMHEVFGPGPSHIAPAVPDPEWHTPQPRPLDATEVDVVSIALGPVLRARTGAIVSAGLVGDSVGAVVQTLFILGLLEAEGMRPDEYVGEPKQHVSAEAAFVRFALPHSLGDERRVEVLRDLFAWLHGWLGDDDRLQPAASAALAALPR